MTDLMVFSNDENVHTQALSHVEHLNGARHKMDELFAQFLSLSTTSVLVDKLVDDARAGKPLQLPTLATSHLHVTKLNPSLSPVRGRTASPPPRSPSRSPSLSSRSPDPKSPPPNVFTFEDGSQRVVHPHVLATSAIVNSASPPKASPPKLAEHSPLRPMAKKFQDDHSTRPSTGSALSRPAKMDLPRFYEPGAGGRGRGRPVPGESLKDKLPTILDVWKRHVVEGVSDVGLASVSSETVEICGVSVSKRDLATGLPVEQFAAVAKTLCGFPSFFAAPLFRRVRVLFSPRHQRAPRGAKGSSEPYDASQGVDTEGVIPLEQFIRYWSQFMQPYDHVDRFLMLLAQPDTTRIVPFDFMPFLEELLAFHPGLAFLESTPEFQEKYARTVIARIMYQLDPLARGFIDGRSLRKSNLIQAFHTVDMEEDINLVNDYFSYEHFYVLYCKFWELDTDRDFLLSREDLSKMDNLTHTVLDRIFTQAGRRFTSGHPNKMGYEDFVCFLMSEEDKTNLVSLQYWFRIVDLNGDGIITPAEMQHFYTEQMQRMADLNMEVVPFRDVLAQMIDLLQPEFSDGFRFTDFIHPSRVRITGAFFSVLFNLQKFTLFEQRDPVYVKQELNEQGVTQWDRFAQFEYMKLAEEEEMGAAEPADDSAMGGW